MNRSLLNFHTIGYIILNIGSDIIMSKKNNALKYVDFILI